MAKIIFEVDVPNDRMAENWYLHAIGADPIKEKLHHSGPTFSSAVRNGVRIPEFLDATVTLKLDPAPEARFDNAEPGLLQGVLEDLELHAELREMFSKAMSSSTAKKAKELWKNGFS
jgi:hypothetical protein